MKIQVFTNGKGLIYGDDPKRISCEFGGTLKIGTTTIKIADREEAILPILFNGCTGEYKATFTSTLGSAKYFIDMPIPDKYKFDTKELEELYYGYRQQDSKVNSRILHRR